MHVLAVVSCGLALTSFGQVAPKARPRPAPTAASAAPSSVDQAEEAIARQDFTAAEKLLVEATGRDPRDHRAWFDLGFVYSATGRKPDAIAAYRKSVEIKPDVFETNLNLGVLLAQQNSPEAEKFLRTATALKPAQNAAASLARAWTALGRLLEPADAKAAADAYRHAADLTPNAAAPHLAAAAALEKSGDLAGAEAEFKRTAELDPKSTEALSGLVNVYTRSKRLPEAEAALRQLLAVDPGYSAAHVQLGRVLAAEGKTEEAIVELEGALAASNDAAALRELAGLHAAAGHYEEAATRYRQLLQADARNPELHYALGTILMDQHKFAEAQPELLAAVQLKSDFAQAYGNLAVVASANKNYGLALKAVDARSRFLPETAATYFLRATAYDHLRNYKQAAANYHQYLRVSDGKNPDQEWQVRHRLIAIEPKK